MGPLIGGALAGGPAGLGLGIEPTPLGPPKGGLPTASAALPRLVAAALAEPPFAMLDTPSAGGSLGGLPPERQHPWAARRHRASPAPHPHRTPRGPSGPPAAARLG